MHIGRQHARTNTFTHSLTHASLSLSLSPCVCMLAQVQANGWLHGFCPGTWAVVCMFALGGLLVAVVIRFTDNNLKNLAMALAIILSCVASIPLFGFVPNGVFACGGLLVIASIFLYAWQPKVAVSNYVPLSTDTPSKA